MVNNTSVCSRTGTPLGPESSKITEALSHKDLGLNKVKSMFQTTNLNISGWS